MVLVTVGRTTLLAMVLLVTPGLGLGDVPPKSSDRDGSTAPVEVVAFHQVAEAASDSEFRVLSDSELAAIEGGELDVVCAAYGTLAAALTKSPSLGVIFYEACKKYRES